MISSGICNAGTAISSNSLSIQVNPNPTISTCQVSGTSFEPGSVINFTATATNGTPTYQYFWNFGNNTGGTGSSTATLFNQPGTYPISVYAVDNNGCRSPISYCDTIQIAFTSVAQFTADVTVGCAPLTVQFGNESRYAVNYLWNFGDGSAPSTDINPTHTFLAPGNYTVTLVAFGGISTDSSIVSQMVIVHNKPTADFQPVPAFVTNAMDTVHFVSNSSDARSWFWDFGDPNVTNDTASTPAASYYYPLNGDYTVTLIVTNEFGCSDTIVKPNVVSRIVSRDFADGVGEVRLYPVPFQSKLTFEIETITAGNCQIILSDLLGRRMMLLENTSLYPGKQEFSWNMGEKLSSGVYFLTVNFNQQSKTFQVIKTGNE
ncbi:MAG: PKD domain-containing protein [Bacteroidia bacterium]|nr:PKD domain-containing protein [Bacteroidia bacterium]